MSQFELVRDVRVERGRGVLINGEVLPYAVSDTGMMVEAVDEYVHLLWVPLIAEGPAPRAGRPDGEPLP